MRHGVKSLIHNDVSSGVNLILAGVARLGAALPALVVAACAAAQGPAGAGPRLEHSATVTWRGAGPDFGGFSGLEVVEGGAAFVAVGDRGSWATGRMIREDGRLVAVETTGLGPLLSIEGTPLSGNDVDAEGLVADGEGGFFVSFEHFHRIRRYTRIDGPAAHVEGHPDFPGLQLNSGLEALAMDGDGTLYAIPERSGAWERPFPVYRLRGGVWDRETALPREGRFLVVGADWGPDGLLYLLERDHALIGFRTRVRRFGLGPEGFDAGETLLETRWRELDNMEGIAVWADAEGAVRVTLLADDNFVPILQSTIFAEYVVVD